MTVLIDSSAWIEYFKGSQKGELVKTILDGPEDVIATPINVFEVYFRISSTYSSEYAEKSLAHMLQRSTLLELGVELLKLAVSFKQRKKMGMADSIILAAAVKENASFVTGDSDFKGVTETEVKFI